MNPILQLRRHLEWKSITALLLLTGVALIVFAKTSSHTRDAYSLAADLPRGALVYAQFENLPELIKQWEQLPLRERYLNSTNYRQFEHKHLALKLVSRWEEFNDALGFKLDLSTISASTEASAAIAVYDIGQFDIAFIAPLGEDKIALTQFFNSKDRFEEAESPDRVTYYRHAVEADRGRQKQVLAFATLKGRFVMTSNEKLLLRTIANINQQGKKDSLADDPDFRALTRKLAPHFMTVWVDQTRLNEDYYFRHYWLMQNVAQLKGLRAGLFDLERQQSKWIEHREFLTSGKEYRNAAIGGEELKQLSSMVPEDAPFLRIRSLTSDPAAAVSIVGETLLDRTDNEAEQSNESWSWQRYTSEDFYVNDDAVDSYNRYSYLNSSYERNIDDPHEAGTHEMEEPAGNPLQSKLEKQFVSGLKDVLAASRPSAAVVSASPYTKEAPLFIEFRRLAIVNLQSPENLRRDLLEQAIAFAAQSCLTVAGRGGEPKWESQNENGLSWRALHLPMLGWEICYAVTNRELIVANSTELLKGVLAGQAKKHARNIDSSGFYDVTIIRLDQRKRAFDDVMSALAADMRKAPNDSSTQSEAFFSGNISSLLNVASDVSRIEIKRSASENHLHEEIEFVLK